MVRVATALTPLLMIACAAPEAPKSLCDLPRSLATWERTPVRWQGVLLHTGNHGMAFVADDCRRRGITIKQWPENAPDEAALNQVARQRWRQPGIIRVDVSGRITSDRALAVSEVHRIQFERMSEQEETAFWRSTGF